MFLIYRMMIDQFSLCRNILWLNLDISDSDESVDDLASLSTRRRIQIGKRKREAAEVDDVSKKPYDADTPAYDLENINKSYGRKYGQVPIG